MGRIKRRTREIFPDRSSLARNAIVALATLVALALLGYVLAYWTWRWFGPRPEPRVAAAVEPVGRGAAERLFGTAPQAAGAAVPTGMAIKLLGVVAGSGGRPGYAVVRFDDKKSLAVGEGKEIVAGLRLAEVYADHVVIERNGIRETLAWPKKNPSADSPAARINN